MHIIDASLVVDLLKLKLYNEYIYTNHIEEEGESEFQKKLTTQVVEGYIDPLNLPKDYKILDLACGPGYFLDEMKARGYTDLTGVTLTEGDTKICNDKGHTVKKYDMSFLPQKDGYYDESVDFIFCRQALEHSPYPFFSLMEYNRVLKQNGKIYIEIPSPDCERPHENNLNHYSIMTFKMLAALLYRTGFKIDLANNMEFDIGVKNGPDEEVKNMREKYTVVIATKSRPLDLK